MKSSVRKGFTLTELIITLAVMGILTAIAIPNYQIFMAQRRLNGAARQVLSDLTAARMRAIALNRDVKIGVSLGYANSYTLDLTGNAITKNIQAAYYDVLLKASITPIVFHPDGASSNLVVKIFNPRGEKMITISRVGRIKIN